LSLYSRIILTVAGVCIALGGLYDVCTPRLPPNLATKCSGSEEASTVIRELLRALGACLVAIGATVGILATSIAREHDPHTITLILILVLPSEGMNAVGMRRVGSPYVVPLFFILLTVAGAALALLASNTK
jgi:hypothetical protein